MKSQLWVLVVSFGVMFNSCQTQGTIAPTSVSPHDKPAGIPETSVDTTTNQTTTEPVEDSTFDPASISQEVFDTTKGEVQALIEKLNLIIRNRDYEAWVQYLSPSYKTALSDSEFLKNASESSRLKNQNIILKNLEDYFLYVVVPSRANDRVDDIEFISKNRVKAYTITNKGQRLRLYELEKTAGNWNIVN
ncbi:hypothetical protein [Gracilinema caldarium]|uniref:Uncharacterized protein n=1 Tax=Gracilinema caldarium (strain ATCC 51460 / DSM 7334 / H1) TaxID=744872 RepID=F8F3H8_GRAC1|nr:hypothetical protein [Gracilinema caldarium]AEJ19554.1 hypothetical protein Spica_1408 [Gracilinema caldarium DSM 7334]